MNPTTNPNDPIMGTGYMPYHYASGRFQTYGQVRTPAPHDHLSRSTAVYDFSTPTPTWRQSDLFPTVEQIISTGYLAVPPSDPETAPISDKGHIARLGLDDVVHQIRSRYGLYELNIYELNQSVCEANNSIHRQVADQGHPADNRQQYSAQKQIQKLYEQQRDERINLWRDVSRLKQVLPEHAQQYLASYRKLEVLGDLKGDVP